MSQLSITLPRLDARGREDFMVSSCNTEAVALVDRFPDWPAGRLALTGPEGCGKSHLAGIWAEDVGAISVAASNLSAEEAPDLAQTPLVLEDADRGGNDTAVFHLWNACAAAGHGLLLTGRAAPSEWAADLPDLRSRFASLTPARIDDPDDALLSVVLLKLFADRQLQVKPALIGYLLPRIERSFAAAQVVVDRLDRESLARGVPLGQGLARTLLEG